MSEAERQREAKRLQAADWELLHKIDAILAEAKNKIYMLREPTFGWPNRRFNRAATMALLSDLRPDVTPGWAQKEAANTIPPGPYCPPVVGRWFLANGFYIKSMAEAQALDLSDAFQRARGCSENGIPTGCALPSDVLDAVDLAGRTSDDPESELAHWAEARRLLVIAVAKMSAVIYSEKGVG